ncbi:hypothetical protein Smic_64350 [Streptomyces microflavus]|uniref:Purine catabolism PurC-like domain-containing protein n=1 Tax=Streptomyces microflavus TaxID=1919 RepID=A0A7J0D031_STRMI|nr:hypothetical protein Smic_64350 [Streptomyces microflavus]
MHVEDLLRLESLDLTLLWGSPPLLAREISGVTATDLEDPGRFLQRGEIVLSGLVWWSAADEEAKTDRFVAALRDAGAAALLAGEETHGTVPEVLVDACRRHGIALLSVPVHTSFRAITDTVYLRQWGDLSRRPADHYALPENVRGELSRLLADGADPDTLLTRAVAHLGAPPCYVLSATGRTIARTPAAPPLPARQAARRLKAAAPFAAAPASTTLRVDPDASPYGQWYLHLPGPVDAPPRMLHEIAEVFAQYRQGLLRRRAAARVPATELLELAAALVPVRPRSRRPCAPAVCRTTARTPSSRSPWERRRGRRRRAPRPWTSFCATCRAAGSRRPAWRRAGRPRSSPRTPVPRVLVPRVLVPRLLVLRVPWSPRSRASGPRWTPATTPPSRTAGSAPRPPVRRSSTARWNRPVTR